MKTGLSIEPGPRSEPITQEEVAHESGWVSPATPSGDMVLRARKLSGQGWELGGQYKVLYPITLREDVDLDSAAVGELQPGTSE